MIWVVDSVVSNHQSKEVFSWGRASLAVSLVPMSICLIQYFHNYSALVTIIFKMSQDVT